MMLRKLSIFLLALLLLVNAALAAESLQPSDSIAICGDSITEQKFYSVYMEDYFLMCQPAADLKSCNFGWSGETSWGFAARMNNDVAWFKPTVATTCYGMNDGQYSPMTADKAKRYRDAQRDVVRKFKAMGVRFIVVGSPGCVDSEHFRKTAEAAAMYNKMLAALRDIAREVAEEEGVAFANVYDAMYEGMSKSKARYGNAYVWAGNDGFHPGANGQLAMAYAFLKGLGCNGDIGTITVDLDAKQAAASNGHKVVSMDGNAIEVESTRYPFCFSGESSGQTTRSGAEFLPFNQHLNRLRLIVKGAKADQVKVTWGASQKTFSRADLENGINLAAEFMENPFSAQFNKVHQLVQAQQNFETPMTKVLIHSMWEMAAEAKSGIAEVTAAADKQRQARFNAARAAVIPIKHTIKIE
jgi:lysophospholipase L1-like esterase